jgi:hypothetical protein
MAYFEDLSNYAYFAQHCQPGARNVGWLQRGHYFDVTPPAKETLDLLWAYCEINVEQARGFHSCDLCEPSRPLTHALRNGQRISLGSAEIRVFSQDGAPYAAPNLIYHYVRAHHYNPPQEFHLAMQQGPRPSSQRYFDLLQETQVDWRKAPPADPDVRAYKSEKVNGEIKRLEIERPIHLDLD